MADAKRTVASRLASLRYHRTKLRDDVDRAIHPSGMVVGMPKCTVDACTLQRILDTLDECEAAMSIMRDAMITARSRLGCSCGSRECAACILRDALEVIDDG